MEGYNWCAQPFSPSTWIWLWPFPSWDFPCSSCLGQGNDLQDGWTWLLAGFPCCSLLLSLLLPPLLPAPTPVGAIARAGLKHQVKGGTGRWRWCPHLPLPTCRLLAAFLQLVSHLFKGEAVGERHWIHLTAAPQAWSPRARPRALRFGEDSSPPPPQGCRGTRRVSLSKRGEWICGLWTLGIGRRAGLMWQKTL